jgi:glycosyltransferase involved in cell wall biosynthesis
VPHAGVRPEPRAPLAALHGPLAPALPPGGLASLLSPHRGPRRKRWRVAYLLSHPIQYQAPLLRHLERESAAAVTTLFLSDLSVGPYRDRGFGRDVQWDVDLLAGYAHRFLPCRGRSDRLDALRPRPRDLAATLGSGEFDALWVHGYGHWANLRAIAAADRLGLPVILRGESLDRGARQASWARALRERVVSQVLERTAAALPIGRANRAFYTARGFAQDRLFDAPYAVDNRRFQEQALAARAGRETLRRALALDPARPVVLFAAKLTARKRPLDAIAAVAQLGARRAGPHPYLLLAGDGELFPAARRAVAAAQRQLPRDTFRLLGFRNQSELPALYDLCDALVLPSAYEPWGLVVNEAMNAGRPAVVSSAVGSGDDLVEDGVTGQRVPVGDVPALARALAAVTASRDHARDLGRAALERVSRYDFHAVAHGLEAALERLLPPS